MNCDKCRWYKPNMRELDQDQLEYQRLVLKYEGRIVRFDTRACIMGGCDEVLSHMRSKDGGLI